MNFKELGIKAIIYHSNIKNRKQSLDDFRNDKVDIIITVKALDEGINVPKADMCIITSGTSVARQMKQRVGRILRKSDNIALVYQLYFKNTIDE